MMDTQTQESAAPAAGAVPKPSLVEEFLSSFRAENKPPESAAPPKVEEPAADAAAEGETAEGGEKPKEETVEEPKTTEKPSTLARRLAMVARAERDAKAKAEADAKARIEQDARDKEIRPIIDRITKAQSAKTRMEAAATVLNLDEEGIAELYLELQRHHEENEPGKKKTEDPTANLETVVAKLLDAKLKERDEAQKAHAEKTLNDQRAAYFEESLGVLDAQGDEFPLVAIAPASQVDITAISEAWFVANGEIPEPEAVLKIIQDTRQKTLDEKAKAKAAKAAKPVPTAKTEGATGTGNGEASGSKTSVKRDDVALKPSDGKKPTMAEEFLAAYRAQAAST